MMKTNTPNLLINHIVEHKTPTLLQRMPINQLNNGALRGFSTIFSLFKPTSSICFMHNSCVQQLPTVIHSTSTMESEIDSASCCAKILDCFQDRNNLYWCSSYHQHFQPSHHWKNLQDSY